MKRLSILAKADGREKVELLVRESAFGAGLQALVSRTGLPLEEVEAAAKSESLVYFEQPHQWLLDKEWMNRWLEKTHKTVAAFHRDNPLLPGMSKQEVRSKELGEAPVFLMDAMLGFSRTLTSEGDLLRLSAHKLSLREDEEEALGKMESAFEQAGLEVPALKEVLASCGVDASRSRSLLQILMRRNRLVRVSEDLVFHSKAIDGLKAMLARHKGERFAVPAFKEWTAVSRKYAIPLLEFLDRERVTRREGDVRVVL